MTTAKLKETADIMYTSLITLIALIPKIPHRQAQQNVRARKRMEGSVAPTMLNRHKRPAVSRHVNQTAIIRSISVQVNLPVLASQHCSIHLHPILALADTKQNISAVGMQGEGRALANTV